MIEERFEKLLNEFCQEHGYGSKLIRDAQDRGRLLKVNDETKTILHRVEHLLLFDYTDEQIQQELDEIKQLLD